jgi:hypothetical protein
MQGVAIGIYPDLAIRNSGLTPRTRAALHFDSLRGRLARDGKVNQGLNVGLGQDGLKAGILLQL